MAFITTRCFMLEMVEKWWSKDFIVTCIFFKIITFFIQIQRRIQGEARGARAPPFLAITCFFCNHFEELQTVLFEIELIINNALFTQILSKHV